MEARLIRRFGVALALAGGLLSAPVAAAPSPAFDRDVAAIQRRMATDPEQAITVAREARQRLPGGADAADRRREEATLLWLEGEAQVRIGDPHQGLRTLARAGELAGQDGANQRLSADILLSRGSGLTDTGNVTQALLALQRAHDMFVRIDDQRSRARALILIALLYVSAHDYDTALRYFAQARDTYPNDAGLAMAVDNGRGNALLALGRFRDAEVEFRQAIGAGRVLRSPIVIAQSLGNVALAQLRGGNVAGADATVSRALAIAGRSDAAAIRPQLLVVAAGVALRQHDLPQATALVRERFAGVDLSGTILADRDAHDVAYRVLLEAGDMAGALDHLRALKRLDDQATEIARSTGTALAAARFDYANQELRIARLNAAALGRTVAFERATARTQRLIFYGVVGTTLLVITLLALGLTMLGRSRNRVRAANADLAESNEQLAKLSRAKTEFLATTSHEIRTPLNGILGMTQVMIADGGLNAVTRDRLDVVHGAGLTMRALVDDILDMAKIETGRMTIEQAPLDLHATIEDAARLWREPALAKGIDFHVEVGDVPRWVLGDAARLRQIVFNLLSNAVKFTEAGSVSLLVAQEDDRLRLAVTDSGIGIGAEAQRLIFDSFRQAEAGTTRRFGGTGLGLSICRSLAQAMGGDVTVTSRTGVGSCFTVDLPCVATAAPDAERAAGGLLIVERNPINRAMYRKLFGERYATSFADGDDARAMIDRIRPERILVDAATIDPAGTAVAAGLSDLVARAGRTPVALLTSAIDDTARQAICATGITRIIEKPVSKKALVDAIVALPDVAIRDAA